MFGGDLNAAARNCAEQDLRAERSLDGSHTHINDVSINEISFQPPQTRKVMTARTKRLAVNNSRPGCAVGGKSRPSSESTQRANVRLRCYFNLVLRNEHRDFFPRYFSMLHFVPPC